MTDRERQLIEAYLPNPPDPELGFMDYYVRDTADRVRKVHVSDFFPHEETMEYDVYEISTGKRIDSGWADRWRGFHRGQLYDNREDCRNHEHDWYDGWEELRRIQRKEGLI